MEGKKIYLNIMKSIKRYIPGKVKDFILNSDYKNKDHLFTICDMVNRISIYRKEDRTYSNEFIDIPQNYFRDIISKFSSFDEASKYLKENILECDNVYSKEAGKALGYRFKNEFISKLVSVEIESKPISKRIIKNVNEKQNRVSDELKKYKEYFLNNFKIDFDGALKYINDWFNDELEKLNIQYTKVNSSLCSDFFKEWVKLVNRYNSYFISISAINDGELFIRKNQTNGRIDTNLTSLKKELKKFIKIDNLVQIDIKNSQPYFLYNYLHSTNPLLCSDLLDKDELEKYRKSVEGGTFYEFFQNEYYKKTDKMLSRDNIKEIMFCIFYSKNTSYIKEKNIFKSIFPTIYKFIKEQKSKKHNNLAIKMQQLESDICVYKIIQKLDDNDINYLTIHDAWLVKKEDLERTYEIIQNEFIEKFNSKPTFDIEVIKTKEKIKITEKIKIKYRGYKEVEIDLVTDEDKKLFMDKIKKLKEFNIEPSERILLELNLFDEHKTWYIYNKYIKKYGYTIQN